MPKSDFKKAQEERRRQKSGQLVVREDPYSVVLPQQEQTSGLHSDTVAPLEESTLKTNKTSFYLTAGEIRKLKELEIEYYQRTGQSVNRNDLVRYLIDTCTLDTFSNLDLS